MQSVIPKKSYYECLSCENINDFDDPVCIKCGNIQQIRKSAVILEMEEIGHQAGESSYRLRQIAGFCVYLSGFSIYLYIVIGKWTMLGVVPLILGYAIFLWFLWNYKEEFSKIVISETDFDAARDNEDFAWLYIAISIIVGFGTIFL